MTMLIIALICAQAVVPNVQGTNLDALKGLDMDFKTEDDVMSFALDVKTKTSEEEQTVLKTLMKERGQWHPEAESLLKDVVKRPSSRRLSAVGVHCDASTETLCKTQVDEQCGPCVWSQFKKCRKNECPDYKDKTKCCANAVKVATGCHWNTATSSCVPKTCKTTNDFGDGSTAAGNTDCKAQPGCSLVCEKEEGAKTSFSGPGKCLPKGDYKCDATKPGSPAVTTASGEAVDTSGMGNALGKALGGAMMGGSGAVCNILDCTTCMKSLSCEQKKDSALGKAFTGDMGSKGADCKSRCSALATTPEAVECLFCGPKAAGCTPAQAAPFASCTTVAVTDIIKPKADPKCDDACTHATLLCPTAFGSGKCKSTGGAGTTSGAAGLTAAMVGLLSPVFAFLMM